MKEKAPGTLTEWVSLYLTNGWAEFSEIKRIMSDMLHFLGPVSLDEIIEKAKELKESFEADILILAYELEKAMREVTE